MLVSRAGVLTAMGVGPFALFALLFLLLPTSNLLIGAFQDGDGVGIHRWVLLRR